MNWFETYKRCMAEKAALDKYNREMEAYNSASWFKKIFIRKPKDESWEEPAKLADEYVAEWNGEYTETVVLDSMTYATIFMKYDKRMQPVIYVKALCDGCYFIQRYEVRIEDRCTYLDNTGCPYPYSECGVGAECDRKEFEQFYKSVGKKLEDLLDKIGNMN